MADWRSSDWLTAAEIADLALAGMPHSKRGINKHIDRHGWRATPHARRRCGRGGGGGWEYHVSLLPAEALNDLLTRRLVAAGADRAIEMPSTDSPEMARALARVALVLAADARAQALGPGRKASLEHFCRLYNAGRLPVSEAIRRHVPGVSPASLRRWRKWLKERRIERLANTARRRPGRSPIDRAENGRLADYLAALVIARPQLSAAQIRDLARAEFGEIVDVGGRRRPLPSLRAFQRWLNAFHRRNAAGLAAATNPDLYKSKYRHAGASRDGWVKAVNDLWEIDASPADVMTTDGRVSVYVCVDAFSRRMLVHVSKTPRTQAMLELVSRAIREWGVPRVIRSDNGSDFTSHQARLTFRALGIEHDVCPPFSPQKKGKVERAIRTLMHGLMPLLPGYVGHNVAERKVIEARKAFGQRLGEAPERLLQVDLSMAELQRIIDRWVATVYERRPHRGLGGRTPFAVAGRRPTPRRRVADEQALAMLSAPLADGDGTRVVGREGVRVNGHVYITTAVAPGASVLVRLDPADMGRIWLFDPDSQEYLGEARCPELSGIDPEQAHAAARKAQDALVKEAVAEARRRAREITRDPRRLVNALLTDQQRRDEPGRVLAFPPRTKEHVTPAISSAAAREEEPASSVRPDILERESARLLDEWERQRHGDDEGGAEVVALVAGRGRSETEDDDVARMRRALLLERRQAAGEVLPEADVRWLAAYQTSAEYRAGRMLAQDFPDLYGLNEAASNE